jgi:hypothetical protein
VAALPRGIHMALSESDIRRSLECARAAFPYFTDWEYHNEINEWYSGFSLWGEFGPDLDDPMGPRFFITLDAFQSTWRGHLTTGQHSYFWSSADCGDAHLLGTGPCATLGDAIGTLKKRLAELFTAFSVEPPRAPRLSRNS